MDVATGIIYPLVNETRTEADFKNWLTVMIESDPSAKQWHFVMDRLNTHMSESAVKIVADIEGTPLDALGEKGKSGILKNMKTRMEYLSNPEHKVIFHYTPKHASWLNQIEIWFSILARKYLNRNNFNSLDELKNGLYSFVEFFNKTMAKPFKWTYAGRPLQV